MSSGSCCSSGAANEDRFGQGHDLFSCSSLQESITSREAEPSLAVQVTTSPGQRAESKPLQLSVSRPGRDRHLFLTPVFTQCWHLPVLLKKHSDRSPDSLLQPPINNYNQRALRELSWDGIALGRYESLPSLSTPAGSSHRLYIPSYPHHLPCALLSPGSIHRTVNTKCPL